MKPSLPSPPNLNNFLLTPISSYQSHHRSISFAKSYNTSNACYLSTKPESTSNQQCMRSQRNKQLTRIVKRSTWLSTWHKRFIKLNTEKSSKNRKLRFLLSSSWPKVSLHTPPPPIWLLGLLVGLFLFLFLVVYLWEQNTRDQGTYY